MTAALPILNADYVKFLRLGLSITAAACDRERLPTLSRCCGCRLSEDATQVTVFMSARQAANLLACIRDNGALAVVFSEPSTHRTLQLKGTDATVVTVDDSDHQLITNYREAFARELGSIGYSEEIVGRTLVAYPRADIVGIRFTPTAMFSQTPGPQAGAQLSSAP